MIQTAATPGWAMKLAYFNCGAIATKDSTLAFCGFKPVRLTQLGGVGKDFTEAKAKPWLAPRRTAAHCLKDGLGRARPLMA